MAQSPDTPGPTTSYSDPIYDRLESVAQRITRRLGLLVLALVVIVVAAVITHGYTRNSPIAASANQFLTASNLRAEAEQGRDPGKLESAVKAFAAITSDESVTPYYRARAYLELTQIELDRSALSEAKANIAKAREWSAKAANPDLDLVVGLSEAAVLLQSGEHAAAEKLYLGVERAAGSTYPDRQIAAVLGAAKAMELQGRLEDAIAKLEVLVNRSDATAAMLLNLAKNEYWALKRRQAAPPAPAAPAPTAEAAPAVPAPAPAAPGAAPVAPAPAAAAPQPAPAAPAAPAPAAAPAPGPEGK
jgi:hypothetical protein